MKGRYAALLVGALLVTGVVALVRVATGSPAPAAATSEVPGEQTPSPVSSSDRVGCAFEPGARFDVALKVQTGIELGAGMGPLPSGTVLAESVSATVRLVVLTTDDAKAVLLGQLTSVELIGPTPASAYAGPFLLEVDRACELSRYARHQTTATADARLQQSALWELGFRWTRGEESLTRHNARGSYLAKATTAPTAGGVLAQRRLTHYSRLWVGSEATQSVGFSSVRAGPVGWFDELRTDETLRSTSGTTHTRVRATAIPATGGLAGVDGDQTHYVFGDWLPTLIARRQAPPVTQGDRALRQKMQDKTAAEAVEAGQSAFKSEQNLAASWPPLRAFLEAHPEKTSEVVSELKAGKVTEEGLNPFFIALGNARTPQAKGELLSVMRDSRAPPTVRARAMFSLVDRADVGVELARELQSSSRALTSAPTGAERFVATEALLAVSTMAGLHDEAEVRAVALESIRDHLRPGADPRSLGTALKALANLGDPALLTEAQPFTLSADERVRRAATKVVRRMRPLDTETFAVSWLAREPSLFVKKDLFVTLEAQHFDARAKVSGELARLLVQELADERHGVIARKALLRLVANSEGASAPSVRAVLKAQARRALKRRDGLEAEALQLLTPEEMREVVP